MLNKRKLFTSRKRPEATRALSPTETEKMEDLIRFIDVSLDSIFGTEVVFHLNFIVNDPQPDGSSPAFVCSNADNNAMLIYMLENALKTAQADIVRNGKAFDA